ncbi:MAG: hypothetical protein M3509_12625, partial [Chloroflexota bacterium]|nr:hypothetical protein [Chloroflexota bacterium]
MAAKLQPIDISDSTEVLNLAEEVRQSGIGRLLKRGEQELAVLTPVDPPLATSTSSDSLQKAPDAILN